MHVEPHGTAWNRLNWPWDPKGDQVPGGLMKFANDFQRDGMCFLTAEGGWQAGA